MKHSNHILAFYLAAIISPRSQTLHRARLIGAKALAVAGIFVVGCGAASLRWVESTRHSARRGISLARAFLAGIATNLPSIMAVRHRFSAGWASVGAIFAGLRGFHGTTYLRNRRRFRESSREVRVTIGSNPTVTNAVTTVPLLPSTPFHRLRLYFASAFSIVGVFVIGFGVWATYAPLESAAIAGGEIEAESSRKTVQHLEGGIVGHILVKDGDEVAAGQPLISLDDTKVRASVQMLQTQLWDAQALEARLMAERDGRKSIEFSQDILAAARQYPAAAGMVAGQTRIFDTRRRLNSSRIDMIRQRIAQTEEEIAGLRFQARAATSRAEIIKGELADVAPLVAKRLQTRARLRVLEREQAEIDGRIGDTMSQISRAEQSIGESQATILKLESDDQGEIAQSLRDTQAQILQLVERIQAARDVLSRTVIRAPEPGTITDLRIHTTGGIIAPGEPLVDLVPSHDRLIVLAQVKPEDIDLVRPGLPAHVRLLSYKHRRVPPVDGVLTYVSADRMVDSETKRPYYIARVRITEASLRALPEVEIMPGMPVEVMIRTGQFTVAHYALRPVFDAFDRAFRED